MSAQTLKSRAAVAFTPNEPMLGIWTETSWRCIASRLNKRTSLTPEQRRPVKRPPLLISWVTCRWVDELDPNVVN